MERKIWKNMKEIWKKKNHMKEIDERWYVSLKEWSNELVCIIRRMIKGLSDNQPMSRTMIL